MKNVIAFLLSLTLLFSTAFALAESGKVNINTANVATLAASLQGVGPKKAQAIVDFRTENGLFKTIDDLTLVSGIGPKLLARNRDIITVVDDAVITEEAVNTVETSANNTEVSEKATTETKHVTTKVTETVTDEVETKTENQTAANNSNQSSAAQTKTTTQIQQ